MTYTFTQTESPIEHADHNWEEFHAYVAADLPDNVSRDATGICCHDCERVVLDPEPATDALY